jgi:uncharacterized protein (DUF58 family)
VREVLASLRRLWTAPSGASTALDDAVDTGALIDDEILRQSEALRLSRGATLTTGFSGEHSGGRRAFDIEFADYRGYAPGDDVRSIDWNAYARLGQLFVKTGVVQEALTLSLLVDTSRSMDSGRPNKLRYAKRLAAILGAVAVIHGDTVYLAALGGETLHETGPLRGRAALGSLERALQELPLSPTTALSDGLEAYRRLGVPRGLTIVISDMLVPSEEIASLGYLADGAQEAALLHLVSPDEADPPLRGLVELRDRETAAALTLVVTPGLRRRYRTRLEEHGRTVASACARYGLRYLRLPLTASPLETVLTTLRDGEIVR